MDPVTRYYNQFVKENNHWLRLVINWFLLAAFAGAITFFVKPELLQTILSAFAERFGENPSLNLDLAIQIFIQNMIVSSIALLGGILFGIGSFFIVVVNGFLIGFVVMSLLFFPSNIETSISWILAGLVPHGILEIPAFLSAATLGLRWGIEGKGTYKKNFFRILKFLPVLVCLLFIAAIVEVFVSGKIVGNL